MLITFSAYADISAKDALNITTQDAFIRLKDHFQLESPDQLRDSISIAKAKDLRQIDDQEYRNILQKYPRQSAFYVNVQMNDCVVQSMLYIIEKQSGKIQATIFIGDEISIQ